MRVSTFEISSHQHNYYCLPKTLYNTIILPPKTFKVVKDLLFNMSSKTSPLTMAQLNFPLVLLILIFICRCGTFAEMNDSRVLSPEKFINMRTVSYIVVEWEWKSSSRSLFRILR